MEPERDGVRGGCRGRGSGHDVSHGNERKEGASVGGCRRAHPASDVPSVARTSGAPCHPRRKASSSFPPTPWTFPQSRRNSLRPDEECPVPALLSGAFDSNYRLSGVFTSFHRHPAPRPRSGGQGDVTFHPIHDLAVPTCEPCAPQRRARMRRQARRFVGRPKPSIASERDRCYAQEAGWRWDKWRWWLGRGSPGRWWKNSLPWQVKTTGKRGQCIQISNSDRPDCSTKTSL
mmetsp:Transcript_5855/g.36301  ORF Transcript_5855/g.36301 Transcript_5855/m.36301 type:complete len:232 (+) Transcript_5855:7397-8092(+)